MPKTLLKETVAWIAILATLGAGPGSIAYGAEYPSNDSQPEGVPPPETFELNDGSDRSLGADSSTPEPEEEEPPAPDLTPDPVTDEPAPEPAGPEGVDADTPLPPPSTSSLDRAITSGAGGWVIAGIGAVATVWGLSLYRRGRAGKSAKDDNSDKAAVGLVIAAAGVGGVVMGLSLVQCGDEKKSRAALESSPALGFQVRF